MKWCDESIFLFIEHYEKSEFLRKIFKIEICLRFFFCRYHLLAKYIVVSVTRRLASVSGARNRRQKMVSLSLTLYTHKTANRSPWLLLEHLI